ncbi:MAG: hypothetical protein ACD_45C00507G0011 [uncultured bacterium]|nr:MAG: hypothetical protein ACD_45C00507G0011 [uncultured bacterium]
MRVSNEISGLSFTNSAYQPRNWTISILSACDTESGQIEQRMQEKGVIGEDVRMLTYPEAHGIRGELESSFAHITAKLAHAAKHELIRYIEVPKYLGSNEVVSYVAQQHYQRAVQFLGVDQVKQLYTSADLGLFRSTKTNESSISQSQSTKHTIELGL